MRPTLASAFKTWDAQHYLYLSQHAYQPGHPSNALYPLWPWVIAAGDRLLPGGPLAASLGLVALLSAGAGVLFHRLAARRLGPAAADLAVVLLMAQPAAFFFGLPYAEALFLLIALVVVDCLERGRLLAAGLAAFLLPLSRPPGVFIVFPVAAAGLPALARRGTAEAARRRRGGAAAARHLGPGRHANGLRGALHTGC